MRSEKQIQASRTNGSKSRGPVTAEGRRNSAENRKHRLICANAVVLEGESRKQFLKLLGEFQEEFQPRTASHRLLVEKLAMAQWRQSRLLTYERNAILRESAKQRASTGIVEPSIVDGLAFESLTRSAMSEYEMRLDRQVARWYDRLMKIKYSLRSQETIENKRSPQIDDPKENPTGTRDSPPFHPP
jgi:hypothetical protein